MLVAPKRLTPRKRVIPPAPPPQPEFGVLAGLDERLGLAFWQLLRNVHVWAATPPERRKGLFQPINTTVRERLAAARRAAPDLVSPLGTLALLQKAPEAGDPAAIACACHFIYEWADRHALIRTALYFAEAAAYAEPTNPTWAVDAAWICRRAGGEAMHKRSSPWYHRGFRLAVRQRNRFEQIRALTGYGALMKDLGRFDKAQTAYEDAVRRAQSARLQRRGAVALHYVFAMEVEQGNFEAAISYAKRALNLYPLHDKRLPYLAADVGFLLLRLHHYRLALGLLESASERMDRPAEMGLLLGSTAWAAAAVNRLERYQATKQATLALVEVNEELAAASLILLAEGARCLGEWECAEHYARAGVEIAEQRGQSEEQRVGNDLLDAVARREPSAPGIELPSDAPPVVLTRQLAARLRRWKRRGRGIAQKAYGSGQGSLE